VIANYESCERSPKLQGEGLFNMTITHWPALHNQYY